MDDFVTKEEFSLQQQNFMKEVSEIKKGVCEVQKEMVDLKLLFAQFPKQLADEFDKRYAKKELEVDVEKLRDRQESNNSLRETRSYDWLKYSVATLVGIVVFMAIYSKF